MINKNIKTNNMTIVRNIAYKQIEKMNKNIMDGKSREGRRDDEERAI